MEEERRLAYVGITGKSFILLMPFSRLLYGRIQRNQPSRFVEIDSELLQFEAFIR